MATADGDGDDGEKEEEDEEEEDDDHDNDFPVHSPSLYFFPFLAWSSIGFPVTGEGCSRRYHHRHDRDALNKDLYNLLRYRAVEKGLTFRHDALFRVVEVIEVLRKDDHRGVSARDIEEMASQKSGNMLGYEMNADSAFFRATYKHKL